MAVEGRMRCVKFLLFSCNIIFLLYGLFVMMVGLAAVLGALPGIDPEVNSKSSIVIIVIGIITVLIAFFGCCGAWKENICMITTFVILQSVYLILEILITIATIFTSIQLNNSILQDIVREYKTKEEFMNLKDKIQQQNFTDWADFRPDGMSVPDSCCWNVTEDCVAGAMNGGYNIAEVCRAVSENMLNEGMLWFGIPALVIAFMETLDIVLACTLMYGIRKGYSIVERQKDHFRT